MAEVFYIVPRVIWENHLVSEKKMLWSSQTIIIDIALKLLF